MKKKKKTLTDEEINDLCDENDINELDKDWRAVIKEGRRGDNWRDIEILLIEWVKLRLKRIKEELAKKGIPETEEEDEEMGGPTGFFPEFPSLTDLEPVEWLKNQWEEKRIHGIRSFETKKNRNRKKKKRKQQITASGMIIIVFPIPKPKRLLTALQK